MIFHLVFNSLFVFIALSLFVELFLFLFQIKNARLRTVCRYFPIFKLPFDLLIFTFFDESLFVNLNPFSCELFFQNFIGKIFQINSEVTQLVPTQYLANKIPTWITLGLSALCLGIIGRKLYLLVVSNLYLRNILASSIPCPRAITNDQLKEKLMRLKVNLSVSPDSVVPFAAHRSNIIFPQSLYTHYSQEEFEAIIAHELEHLRWNDPLLKMVNRITFALFWWVPSEWWIRRLETDQEMASDLAIHRYGIEPHNLASAFVKTAKRAKGMKLQMVAALCPFAGRNSNHSIRIENILRSGATVRSPFIPLKFALGIGLCLLSFFSLWIC